MSPDFNLRKPFVVFIFENYFLQTTAIKNVYCFEIRSALCVKTKICVAELHLRLNQTCTQNFATQVDEDTNWIPYWREAFYDIRTIVHIRYVVL